MEDDRATVETTVSADPHPDNSEVVHRGLASRALPSSISSILQKSGRLLKRGQERDDWGLCSLEDFEHALPPSLKEGKKSLAALASQLSGGPGKDLAQPYQLALAQALSNGSSENLVGMTISLQNLQPLDRSSTEAPLPKQDLLVTGVLGYYRWSLVVNTVDVETKKEFSVSIPIVSNSDVDKYDDNGLEQQVRVAAEEEKGALLQVCGSIPAKSAASQKGVAVPYYTGQVLRLDNIHTTGDFKIFNTVSVMGKVVGDISSVVSIAEGLEPNMKNYIAHRLLHIVLKLERSAVGHMQLGWRSLFLREDGSFVLGNFCSCAPFGEEKSRLSGLVQLIQEPSVLTRFVDSKRLVPDAKANLWNLGVLLFQLYTGTEHPYAEVVGPGWRSDPSAAAFQLLRMEIRSEMLIPQLERSKVPLRWGGLILRLLEPQSVNRITAFQLVQEFPDLIGPQSVAND
ncbi:hypothetical protein EMWEY_00034380 [Eimeria maxima]|uniref:Protein kinase domain-containing protein n=1 Tax=Eimeria maxima TaxID=5804 RepID=U6M9P0_EIMMA|nr:hypothetical protein EMWEY_00034380 [Eimeria maxima]CDJ60741.1 hypothetical protein EMWEY_00034380 [Eimeria maxima]